MSLFSYIVLQVGLVVQLYGTVQLASAEYCITQAWPNSGSLLGFMRILRKYRIYSCIIRKILYHCSP